MLQLIKPKFRFALYLILDQNQQKRFAATGMSNPIWCHADSYDIKEDGSIVFNQTLQDDVEKKKYKVPVLSYPNGKWECCVLLDDNGNPPVFQNTGSEIKMSPSPIVLSKDNSSPFESRDDFSSSDSNFDGGSQTENNPLSVMGMSSQFVPPQVQVNNGSSQMNNYVGMPGVGQNNPQEFKRQKNEWMDKHIKEYTKTVDHFDVLQFIKFLQKDSLFKQFKPTEDDIVWKTSVLIRDKAVLSRKFSDPATQKVLALNLQDVMKRQWAGKMTPIVETLRDREETKNVTAIDVAVWMIVHNFQAS